MKVFCDLDDFLNAVCGVWGCVYMGAEGCKVDAERPAGRLRGQSTGRTTASLSRVVVMGKDKSRHSQKLCKTKSAQLKDRR